MRPEYRVRRDGDFEAFYGRAAPGPWVGFVATVEDVVVGIAGVIWHEAHEYRAVGFVDCPQKYMPKLLTAHRMARSLMQIIHDQGEPAIYVMPDRGIATAKPWLSALGFQLFERHGEHEVWSWPA